MMEKLFTELRRRNVFRVAGVYAVVGWLIAQAAVLLETSLGLPRWFDGVIVSALLLGFPLAVIFAWIYELTPEGLKRTAAVPENESIAPKTGRKLDFAILAGLGLVLITVVADRLMPPSLTRPTSAPHNEAGASLHPAEGAPTLKTASVAANAGVAVLPFENRSVREEDAFFAEGIHDDLLTQLSKISALRVISRTSVMGYAGTTKKIPEIAGELGVAAVLEGAVQRSGARVRINVQLIDGATDAHLWAENYDRELTTENLFDIQAEITEAIAAALKAVLTGEEKAGLAESATEDVAAYEAYIRGMVLSRYETAGLDGLHAAVAAFDEAIRLDPQFAAAYSAKATALLNLYWTYTGELSLRESARTALERAEDLAPDAAETLEALGYYHYWGFLDYRKADAFLDRAVKKAPNGAGAWVAKAYVARRDGRVDDAIASFEKALRLDPLNVQMLVERADTHATFGEFPPARGLIARAKELNPAAYTIAQIEAGASLSEGDIARSWAAAVPLTDENSAWRFYYARATRDPEKIKFALDNWPVAHRRPAHAPESYELARAEAFLMFGRKEEAAPILAEIKARIDASSNPYPQGWNTNALVLPWDFPGLMGDLKGVRAAASDYEKNAPRDVYAQFNHHYGLAIAFTRGGDSKTALDYLERIAETFGPASYLRFSVTPAFDPLRNDKRYRALQAAYEAWAAERGGE